MLILATLQYYLDTFGSIVFDAVVVFILKLDFYLYPAQHGVALKACSASRG